jgi:hypothetical protein
MRPLSSRHAGVARRFPLRILRRSVPLLVLFGLLLVPRGAEAQLMHLDAVPWFTPADSTSRLALIAEVNRFQDDKYDWTLNRILLTVILPAGDDAVFFLRLPHMTFDTGNVTVAKRWPWVIGEDGQGGWPHEKRIASFGQIEVGATGPIGLSMLGMVDFALALGLPTGTDRLYPFSSTSLPLRLELKKTVPLAPRTHLGLVAGYLANMDSGRDNLTEAAFPNGFHLGASVNFYRGRGGRYSLDYDYQNRDGRRSQLAGVQAWMPWGGDGSFGLKVAREMQGTLDRPAAWYFTLAWRLDSAGHRIKPVPANP